VFNDSAHEPSLPYSGARAARRTRRPNSNKQSFNGTFTFHIAATGSDGSKLNFQKTAHFSVSARGATVEFDKLRCA
jgi:hypothetical protein